MINFMYNSSEEEFLSFQQIDKHNLIKMNFLHIQIDTDLCKNIQHLDIEFEVVNPPKEKQILRPLIVNLSKNSDIQKNGQKKIF